jgi:hypothetical protein
VKAAPRLPLRALVALALPAAAWASLGAIDAATDSVQRRAEAAQPAPAGDARPALPPGRVFVLLIDSLRAASGEAMPIVQELRGRSLFVHVDATQDAATVPSVRAAFSGQAQRSIFAFARNFVHSSQALPSIFSQLGGEGGRAVVFSDGSFYELAPGAAEQRSNEAPGPGDEQARQRRAFEEALAIYRAGAARLVVFHTTIVDHVAHWHPVGDPTYVHAFEVADALVREAAATIGPDDTLVVMGDHGHDESGRHFPGLRVPTIALYRGPRFTPGTTLGPVPLTIHRYLLSWALGLPLTPAYRGPAAPNALAGAPPPEAFVSPPPEISTVDAWRARAVRLVPLVLVLALAGTVVLARTGAGRALVAAAPVAAVFFVAWGAGLARRRMHTRPPLEPEILAAWGLALVAAIALTWRGQRRAATWLALALPGLLLYPSAAWDSWAAIMGPVWIVALAALITDWLQRRARGDLVPAATRQERLALAALPLLAALVLPFFYAETDGVVAGDWRGYLTSDRLTYWIAISAAAKLVIFVRPRRGIAANAVGLGLVALFSLVSFGGVCPSILGRLAAAAFLASAAFAARGVAAARERPGPCEAIASALATGALLMLYRATVVLDERNLLQLELLLAALHLTAFAANTLGRTEDRPWFAAWLEAMALLLAAWTTLALTLHRLEWRFLYQFLAPPVVEARVGWLLPLILARYALPLVLARRLLADVRLPDVASTWRPAAGALGLKLATLVLVITGSAILDPTSEPFRGAIQNVLAVSVLAFALVHEPRRAGMR